VRKGGGGGGLPDVGRGGRSVHVGVHTDLGRGHRHGGGKRRRRFAGRPSERHLRDNDGAGVEEHHRRRSRDGAVERDERSVPNARPTGAVAPATAVAASSATDERQTETPARVVDQSPVHVVDQWTTRSADERVK